MSSDVVGVGEFARMLELSESTVRQDNGKHFPRPMRVSGRARVWYRADIDGFLATYKPPHKKILTAKGD